MKRLHLLAGAAFAAIGIFVTFQGYHLRLEGQYGPGPGFFPFWIGLGITTLSVVWFGQVVTGTGHVPTTPDDAPRPRLWRLVAIVGALAAFAALLRTAGFDLSMLALLLFLFFLIDRQHVIAKLIIALLGSFGLRYVFEQLLRVPLPYASISFLRDLGI